MKKILSIILVISLIFSLTACNTESDSDTEGSKDVISEVGFEDEDIVVENNEEELPRYKIAFGYGNWETVLGAQFQAAFEYLCNAFNIEGVLFDAGGGEESVATVESLLAAGDIDGILTISWDTARMTVADKYGVPVVAACQAPSDVEIANVAAYDLYLGATVDDEFWAGYQAMKALYEAGSRNITISGLTTGYSKGHDDRVAGAKQFLSEHEDINLLTESYSVGKWDEDVPTFAASFPEIDGMWFTALNDAVYNVLESESLADGSVKIAGPDVASRTGEFFERDIQVWSCGGQYATTMISFAILYNYIADGTRIIPDSSESIARNYLEIASYEDYLEYNKLIDTTTPVYTSQEIANMIHVFNEDITYDDFVNNGKTYSLSDINSRRGN